MRIFNFISSSTVLPKEISNVIWIDGRDTMDLNAFYDQIQTQLEWPDYFGNNLDALFDALYDQCMETANSNLYIGFKSTQKLLNDESSKKIEDWLMTLYDAALACESENPPHFIRYFMEWNASWESHLKNLTIDFNHI